MNAFRPAIIVAMSALAVGCHMVAEETKPQQREPAMKKTRLQLAIERGSQPGANLAEAIGQLDDYAITRRQDAEAICEALAKIPFAANDDQQTTSDLHALTGLFQDVDGPECDAFPVLQKKGTAHLVRIFDASLARLKESDEDDLLFLLKVLAMYGTREGADRVVKAARLPLKPDGYMWSVILATFSPGHPQREFIYRQLAHPLPEQFIAVALMDSATSAALEGDTARHPFDSDEGIARLRQWLSDDDPEHFSYAVSSAATLAYIKNVRRSELLELAWKHVHVPVRMEAAWASAKAGSKDGLNELVKLCLDVNYSEQAQRYLEELEHAELVPAAAEEPDFRAKAEFAQWLAHPNELGQPPDELEIVDQRVLMWPPERDEQPFWLIRFRLRDRTGLDEDDENCGLVGSSTWCFFSRQMHQHPPEDAYAIHCYWEMKGSDLITELEQGELSEYKSMLQQWSGDELESPKILRVAELSGTLKHPQKLVVLASARLADKQGWVALDGPRSAWYAKDEMPEGTSDGTVLEIHVGRQLLGFTGEVDRKKYFKPKTAACDHQEIVTTYEDLLSQAAAGDERRRQELLNELGAPISKYFDKYVDSLAAVRGITRPAALIHSYERLLAVTRRQNDEAGREFLESPMDAVSRNFQAYVEALVAVKRENDVVKLVDDFRPVWDHNLGYGQLGSATFKAGRLDLAEPFLVKLHRELEDYCRAEEMSMLAEIRLQNGKRDEARDLLVDCMQKLIAMIKKSKYPSDRQTHENEFQHQRQTFLRLFPDSGESELNRLGIPDKVVE